MRIVSRRASIFLPVAILLAGCSAPPIYIAIEDVGGQKVVTLSTRGLFGFLGGEPPCVRRIVISNFDALHEPHPAWTAIARDEDPCPRLRSFVIGRAPQGFIETAPLPAGPLRGRYRVEVAGVGSGSYDIVF